MDQDAILLASIEGYCLDARLPSGVHAYSRYLKEINRDLTHTEFARRCTSQHGGVRVKPDEVPSIYRVISLD